MAQDKLKKPAGRNQQPPSSFDGGESAYGNPPISKVFEEKAVYTPSGVIKTQKADHGNQYPGRKYPKPSKVELCTPKEGEARKGVTTQTHSNMHERNAHEEKKVK